GDDPPRAVGLRLLPAGRVAVHGDGSRDVVGGRGDRGATVPPGPGAARPLALHATGELGGRGGRRGRGRPAGVRVPVGPCVVPGRAGTGRDRGVRRAVGAGVGPVVVAVARARRR